MRRPIPTAATACFSTTVPGLSVMPRRMEPTDTAPEDTSTTLFPSLRSWQRDATNVEILGMSKCPSAVVSEALPILTTWVCVSVCECVYVYVCVCECVGVHGSGPGLASP